MAGTLFAAFLGLVLGGVGVALLVWLLWWLWQRREPEEAAAAIEIKVEELAQEAEEPAEEPEPPAPLEPDDLTRIEGIGPKISSVLQAGGITTFAQLADTDVDQLREILEQSDPRLLRLANPTTWPEQASLAAAGNWDALKALQQELKGGRKE